MSDSEDFGSFDFSVDLPKAALIELNLLQNVTNCSTLRHQDVLKIAAYRYEHFWLPMLNNLSQDEESETFFMPPLDINLIWHAHMLSPLQYKYDCKILFGRVFDNKLITGDYLEDRLQYTQKKWKKLYPSIGFNLPDNVDDILAQYPKVVTRDLKTKLGLDIVAGAARQLSFYYQVSLPHYKNKDFLSECEDRYSKFIELHWMCPDEVFVPCNDIELMWQTHMVHPNAYNRDMKSILGTVLPHDVTPTVKLLPSFEKTSKLWKETFNAEYAKPGTMFRGYPPQEKLSKPSEEFLDSLSLAKYRKYQLFSLQLFDIPSRVTRTDSFIAKLLVTQVIYKDGMVSNKVTLLSGEIDIGPTSNDFALKIKDSEPIVVRNDETSHLEVSITEKAFKMGRYTLQTEKKGILLDYGNTSKEGVSFEISMIERNEGIESPISGIITLKYIGLFNKNSDSSFLFPSKPPKPTLLTIQKVQLKPFVKGYESNLKWCSLPSSDDRIPGNDVQTLVYKIFYEGGSEYLTATLNLSSQLVIYNIRIYAENKLVMMAHMVDSSTIGNLKYYNFLMDHSKMPYWAMLLKDADGDVGILFAFSIEAEEGREAKAERFRLTFYDLRKNNEGFAMAVRARDSSVTFASGSKFNFTNGEILVQPHCSNSGILKTTLALAMSILNKMVFHKIRRSISVPSPWQYTIPEHGKSSYQGHDDDDAFAPPAIVVDAAADYNPSESKICWKSGIINDEIYNFLDQNKSSERNPKNLLRSQSLNCDVGEVDDKFGRSWNPAGGAGFVIEGHLYERSKSGGSGEVRCGGSNGACSEKDGNSRCRSGSAGCSERKGDLSECISNSASNSSNCTVEGCEETLSKIHHKGNGSKSAHAIVERSEDNSSGVYFSSNSSCNASGSSEKVCEGQ